ncbi:MAG: hypothetical protein V4487_05900 [Chlamydiota bacterium]
MVISNDFQPMPIRIQGNSLDYGSMIHLGYNVSLAALPILNTPPLSYQRAISPLLPLFDPWIFLPFFPQTSENFSNNSTEALSPLNIFESTTSENLEESFFEKFEEGFFQEETPIFSSESDFFSGDQDLPLLSKKRKRKKKKKKSQK